MRGAVERLIPSVAPVNPNANPDVQAAQAALDEGLRDSVNALLSAGPQFALTRTQCEHVARIVLIHTFFALENEDVAAARLCPALVDRLDRERWLA